MNKEFAIFAGIANAALGAIIARELDRFLATDSRGGHTLRQYA
jgi:hypothetical protein